MTLYQTTCDESYDSLTVRDIVKTNTPVSSNYCPLAKFIYDNQDGYINRIPPGMTNRVLPDYCTAENSVKVPEFGSMVGVVLFVSIISVLFFARGKFGV